MLPSSSTATDIVMTPNSIPISTEVIHHSTSLHYTITVFLLSTTSLLPTNDLSSSTATSTNTMSSSATTSTNELSSSATTSSNELSSSTSTTASLVSSSNIIIIITPSPTFSITDSITTPLSSIESIHPVLSTGSIISTEVSDTQNTVSQGNPTSNVLVTSKKSSSLDFISKSSVTRSSEPTVLGNTGSDNTFTIIAAVVATVLVLLIISIIVILILIAIAYKRRNKATLILGGHDTCLVNTTYTDIAPNGKEDKGLKDMCNPNYESQGTY